MEAPQDDLIVKVKAIAQGPHADLLRKLVDILFERQELQEEYDEEPLSPEELAAVREGKEAIRRGEFVDWEDFKRKHNL